MNGTSPVMRRALALAILLGLVLVLWAVIVDPLARMVTDRRADIAVTTERLAGQRAILARIPGLERRAAALRTQLDAEGGLWTGTSETAVATAMQEQLRDVVTGGEGVVKTTSQLRGTDEANLHSVRVRLSIDATLDTVEKTLSAIQLARPALFVDNMTIAAPASFSRDHAPQLGLDIEVVGFMRTPQ